ncbi:MAG: hypothetical protein P0120_05035 [Nitrospira sp.]|nr:hypothetical protein [Nitrospira sp.]
MGMKRSRSVGPSVLAAWILLGGCTINHGDFTVLSNKLVNTKEFDLSKADRVKGVTGTDETHIILFIPTKGNITLKGAMDDAMAKGKGDVMTDVTIKTWFWWIPYIYGNGGWEVKGDVVRTRQ